MGCQCCKVDYDQYLLSCTNDNVPIFNFNQYKCSAKIVDVYDGDTFTACFYYQKRIYKYKFRTLGYDSPEMKPLRNKSNREQEIELAKRAREKFIELSNCQNDLVILHMGKFDKYGRILVTVFNQKNQLNVNSEMIRLGHGYEYNGGTKKNNYNTVINN